MPDLVEREVDRLGKAVQESPKVTAEKRAQIVSELKDFTSHKERIVQNYRSGRDISWIRPSGAEGRSWVAEIKYALKHREEGYIPQMTYPYLERGYVEEEDKGKFNPEDGTAEIEKILAEIEERYPNIHKLVRSSFERETKMLKFFQAVRDRDQEAAIANMPYDPPSEDLIEAAKRAYELKLLVKPEKLELGKKLAKSQFNATDIQSYFKRAAEMVGAKGWKIIVNENARAITVTPETTTVEIPHDKKVNGIKLLKLIGHEIGVHVATAQRSIESGFGTVNIGDQVGVIQEGLALLAEEDIEVTLQGYANTPPPYYVLAIDKAIETNGDFWETYDYMKELKLAELSAKKTSQDEESGSEESDEDDPNVDKFLQKVMTRIFRGAVDLSKGGYVFTKDKAYLEGKRVAQKIKEQGLVGYMLAGRYDLENAVFLAEVGVIPKEAVHLSYNVAQQIIADRGEREFMENISWYRTHYNPSYWKELGLSDEKYSQA